MWSDLSVRHLLALRAVAEEGTFGRAATRLGFTQSAVSQQVAALETMVGQTLFDRPGGPTKPTLTPAGKLLLVQAQHMLDAIETAEREIDRFARGVSGRLSVGTFQSVSTQVLPAALNQLYQEAPNVEVSLVEGHLTHDLHSDQADRDDLDLAFTIGEVGDKYDSVYLGEDPHVAVVGNDYPAGAVDLLAIGSAPMVGSPVDDICGILMERQLERLNITPNFAFRSSDNAAIQGMVGAGVGIAVMPLLSVDTNHPTASVRATSPVLEPRRLSLVWSKNRTLSPLAERFIDIVRNVCSEFLTNGEACVTSQSAS